MAVAVTDETTQLVSGTPIFNILNNVELPLVKSLGSSRVGAISFTSYFGPNVTEGLASIEKAESALNNIACLGYENGDRVLWGGTQRRGKIWQQKAGTIAEWIAWTAATWGKVTSDEGRGSNITRDFLRPEKIDRPHDSFPIAVQWGEQAQMRYNDRQFVAFGATEVALFAIDLEIGSVDADGSICIRIVSDFAASEYRLRIDAGLSGGYRHEHVSGPVLRFKSNREAAIALEEYLQKDPFIIRYADGTYSYNCYHIPTALNVGTYTKRDLRHGIGKAFPSTRSQCTSLRTRIRSNTARFRSYKPTTRLFSMTTAAVKLAILFVSKMWMKRRLGCAWCTAKAPMKAEFLKTSGISTPSADRRRKASRQNMPDFRRCITT
jgi:hypothetical protein